MQRISVHSSWGLGGAFGIFQVFELPDGLHPTIDLDRTPPVYAIVGESPAVPIDGKKVDEYLAPIGNDWTLIMQKGTRRYYLLHDQPQETAYVVFDGMASGEGANMMQATEMLKYNAENPTWQA